MADNKQTKTIGEHHVASELARRQWAPALTRDGLERTDILAVKVGAAERRMVEIQVKTATFDKLDKANWLLGTKAQGPSLSKSEFFVFVAVPNNVDLAPHCMVVPRIHVAAAAWIAHMHWFTEPGIAAGKRNTPINLARCFYPTFKDYEDRWDLLEADQDAAPVLLPPAYRDYALEERVGLPPGHEWHTALPEW